MRSVTAHTAVEAALRAWRYAEYRLAEAIGTLQEDVLRSEAERARDEYHRLLAEREAAENGAET